MPLAITKIFWLYCLKSEKQYPCLCIPTTSSVHLRNIAAFARRYLFKGHSLRPRVTLLGVQPLIVQISFSWACRSRANMSWSVGPQPTVDFCFVERRIPPDSLISNIEVLEVATQADHYCGKAYVACSVANKPPLGVAVNQADLPLEPSICSNLTTDVQPEMNLMTRKLDTNLGYSKEK